MTPDELKEYKAKAEALIEAQTYRNEHKREFAPDLYDWQRKAITPENITQTMIMASNRSGKTMSAGEITACHLTNDYPDWWDGYRFPMGLRAMALGVDNTQLKDVVQLELFGEVVQDDQGKKRFTGGWIHPDEIINLEWSPQTPNLLRRASIKGKRGPSVISLRAYTQSKTGSATLSFAGTSLDWIWVDECPPDDLVGQLITRTMTGNQGNGGRILYTMTPELGVTTLVRNFTDELKPHQRLIGPVPWSDCPHLTPEIQEQILAGLPEHEHDMRSKGIPFFGSGLIYTIAEDRIKIDPFDLYTRPWMQCIKAFDLGLNHAIVWVAYDPEDDTCYIVKTQKTEGAIPAAVHAASANSMWPHAPTVFPHDVEMAERGTGKSARHFYENANFFNTLDFKNPDGTIFVEPGIMEMFERMKTARLKVFSTCEEFWSEFRMYHRKDGKIHKEYDHVMDAARYAVIMAPIHSVPLEAGRMVKTKVVGSSARTSR